jgi:hypothetical protein
VNGPLVDTSDWQSLVRIGWRGWFIPSKSKLWDSLHGFQWQPECSATVACVNNDGTVNISALDAKGYAHWFVNVQAVHFPEDADHK